MIVCFFVPLCKKVPSREKAKWAGSHWKERRTSTYTALSSPIFHKSRLISQKCLGTPAATQHNVVVCGTTHAGMGLFNFLTTKIEDLHPYYMKVGVCMEKSLIQIAFSQKPEAFYSFIYPSVGFTSINSIIGNMRCILVWNLNFVSHESLRDGENWPCVQYLMTLCVLFGQYCRVCSHTHSICGVHGRKSVHSHKGHVFIPPHIVRAQQSLRVKGFNIATHEVQAGTDTYVSSAPICEQCGLN